MGNEQNTGVTEARFALTLIICGLVAIGFIVLMRLDGGSNDSPTEVRADVVVPPTAPTEEPILPRVLPLDVPGATSTQEIATLPERTTGKDANSEVGGANTLNEPKRR
jgi:hypothetical protein